MVVLKNQNSIHYERFIIKLIIRVLKQTYVPLFREV